MTGQVVLVTPTRDRPEAFALCEKYVSRQSFRDFTWLVVDDGDTPARLTQGQTYLRRETSPIVNTLPQNMAAALSHPLLSSPRQQLVLMVEDDEWYHREYVATLVMALRKAHKGLVGQSNARYYHLQHRTGHCPKNRKHASLCRTGWIHGPKEALWLDYSIKDALLHGDPFIDMRMWSQRKIVNLPPSVTSPETHLLKAHSYLSVGMKGMPGRAGLGSAHRGGHNWQADPTGSLLSSWTTPEDRDAYFRIVPNVQVSNRFGS